MGAELGVLGWALAIAAAFSVGLAKGGLSMVGVISVPLMALVLPPVQAAGILLPVYIISDIGGLMAYRKHFDWPVLRSLLPGMIGGIALGWATASLVSSQTVGLIVGLIGLSFALRSLTERSSAAVARPPAWGRGTFWGMVAGYTSFVAHAGAAPYQVYVQPLRMSPLTYAGTTTVFFAVGNIVKLGPYAVLGQLSLGNLQIAAVLTVPALIAVRIGVWLVRRMPVKLFYAVITWMLLVVSLRLIWGGVFG